MLRITGLAVLVAVLVAVLATSSSLVASVKTTVPLEYIRGDGCVFDARGATVLVDLPVQREDDLIVIEAETPLRYCCDPRHRAEDAPMPTDPDAAAGGYIDRVVSAQYQFHADAAGDYWLWMRVATPAGRSRVRDIVNGGMWYFLEEKDNEEPQGWHWVFRRKVPLREGINHLTLTEFHVPFPKVDQILFSPVEDYTPEGVYEEARTFTPQSSVETAPVLLPGGLKLLRVTGLPGQTTAVQIAVGDGQWRDVAHDPVNRTADLGAMDAEAPVRFQVALDREAEDATPGRIALVAEVDSTRFVDMRGGHTRCVFDADTGGLFLIENLTTGEAVCCPGRSRPLVTIDFKLAGEAEWTRLGPEAVTQVLWQEVRDRWIQVAQEPVSASVRPISCEGDDERFAATFAFRREGLGSAEVTYVITPADDGAWSWDVSVRALEGPADVVAVEFPIIEHLRIGASGLDDQQFRLQSFGHLAFQPGMHPIRDERYSGGVVMPWQEVHDATSGFYVGAHDPAAINVLFTSRASGIQGEHFTATTRKLDDIKPGEQATYSYVVGAHPGQWHWGADRYREWFHATFGRAEYPAWTRDFDGWLDIQAENYQESFTFAGLGDWLTHGQAYGLNWMQVWGQFAYSLGPCCAAFYQPSPQYGGEDALRDAAAEIVRRGGHVGGYFHYDYLDTLPIVTDWYLGHFRKSEYPADTPWVTADYFHRMRAVLDPSSKVPAWPPSDDELGPYLDKIDAHQELWAAGERAKPVFWWQTMWIDDPDWWEYLRFWIGDKYQREWNCNAAYIDVLGTGGARESYDPRRGHNGAGSWGIGRLGIARTVVEDGIATDPNFVCSMEGLGDLPGLYCMSMCSGVYRGGRNVVRYTFPERIYIHGGANSGSGGSYLDRYLTTFLEAMRYDVVGPPTACNAPLINLQRSFAPWLYDARFMDTLGLTTSHPRVQARWLRKSTGDARGALLTITNRDYLADETVTFDASQIGGVTAGFIVALSGHAAALDLSREGDLVTFAAPEELAAQVLLVAVAGGAESVWPLLTLERNGDPQLALTLLNLTDRAQSGSCAIANLGFPDPRQDELDRAVASLPLTRTAADFSLAPGEAQTLRFPVKSLRRFYYTLRLGATLDLVDAPGLTREFLVTPMAHDSSFEEGGNATGQVVEGAHSLMLGPSDEGYQHRTVRLIVLPNRRYRATVDFRRTGFDAKVHGTALVIKDSAGTAPIVRAPVDATRINEWQPAVYEFETAPDVQAATLYLYNVMSPDTAWFDDIRIEDLGPVE